MDYLKEYKKWCESDEFDQATKEELLKIKDDEKEIEDRFYKELEFGTAGLRGVIGAGTGKGIPARVPLPSMYSLIVLAVWIMKLSRILLFTFSSASTTKL